MSTTELISTCIAGGTLLVWAAWDAVPALTKRSGDTISEVIKNAADRWIAVAFIWGALPGHFFSPLDQWPAWGAYNLAIALGVLFLMLGYDWSRMRAGRPITFLHKSWLWFFVGVIFGGTVWSLRGW